MTAASSSYIKSGGTYSDRVCYRELVHSTDETQFLIIEKTKQFFSSSRVEEYLEDLKTIERFNFTFEFDEKEERYLIDVSKLEGLNTRRLFFMLVRCLWEGEYKVSKSFPNIPNDNFIEIVRHYFNLKENFEGLNTLQRLCVSMNCFIFYKSRYNSNHILSYRTGCKILSDINNIEKSQGVNTYFSIYQERMTSPNNYNVLYSSNITPGLTFPKKAENWNMHDYKKLLNFFFVQYTVSRFDSTKI